MAANKQNRNMHYTGMRFQCDRSLRGQFNSNELKKDCKTTTYQHREGGMHVLMDERLMLQPGQ